MAIKDKVYKGLVGTLGGLVLATSVNAQNPAKPQELSDLLGTRSAYAQSDAVAGVNYEELGKQAEVIDSNKNYTRVIGLLQPYENSPDNKSSLFFNELGLAYTKNGDYKKAEEMYKRAIELAPNKEVPHINLGHLYLRVINTRESRKLAEEQFLYVIQKINARNIFATMYLNGMKKGEF